MKKILKYFKESLNIIIKRRYLKRHGWYQLWHKDNWLQKGKEYSNPDWAGLDTEKAYQETIKKINKT